MLGAISGRFEWFLAVLACIACAVFALVGSAESAPGPHHAAATQTPAVSTAPPSSAVPVALPKPTTQATPKAKAAKKSVDLTQMAAGVTIRETAIRAAASHRAPAISMLRPGIIIPFSGVHGGWLRVLTPCEVIGWVRASDMTLIPPANPTGKLKDAVFVIDPGHGGSESGAIGPATNFMEKDANLGIAVRLAKDLSGSRVYLTRNGNYNTGLRYRAILASRLGATAFLSMHNNSGPTVPSLIPGTQTWHQSRSMASTKLAVILYKNLFATLSKYKANWRTSRKIGPLIRLGDHGHDYYAVLRESAVPAVIVESLFISNPSEERLLRRPDVRQAIADATAKSLRQYIAQGGGRYVKPLPVKIDKDGGLPTNCQDPS